MTLVNQPSWLPTRKLVAMIISGAIMGVLQTLLRQYWPDNPLAPYMDNIDTWLQGAIMVAVGYLVRNRSNATVEQPSAVQELGLSGDSGNAPAPIRAERAETGQTVSGERYTEGQGEKT